jgi:hypothetical protein
MFYNTPTAASKSSFEILITSTGTCPSDWRAWWREQSLHDGTDWVALAWQHLGALSAVRALCESSGASS